MRYLDYFEGVYYINLDQRIDRKILFEQRSKEVGIENSERFSAVQISFEDCPQRLKNEINSASDYESDQHQFWKKSKVNEVGCCLSHIGVIKKAKEKNLNNVLIFEDDCCFLDSWTENIQKCVDDLKKVDWDIIYFGGEINNICEDLTPNLMTVTGGVWTTHAYAVNGRFFDPIINLDINWCSIIDLFYINYDSRQRRYVVPRNLMAIQDLSYSDLKGERNASEHELMEKSWKKYTTKSE